MSVVGPMLESYLSCMSALELGSLSLRQRDRERFSALSKLPCCCQAHVKVKKALAGLLFVGARETFERRGMGLGWEGKIERFVGQKARVVIVVSPTG